MGVVIFFLALSGTLWLYSNMSYLSKDVLKMFATIIAITSSFTYALIMLVFKNAHTPTSLFLFFIPIFFIGFVFMKKKRKISSLEVVANQQRYWNEITSNDVYKFFNKRKKRRLDRIIVRVNEEEKELLRNLPNDEWRLSFNFFRRLKRIEDEFTFICKENKSIKKEDIVKSLKNYKLYTAIFKKIDEFIRKMDVEVDYGNLLKENQNCTEFFLMDLWEKYTKRENIGTANLILLADREIEEELVGALDNIDLNSVKPKGSALYYRFMVFCNRAENYVQKQEIIEEAKEEEEFL